MYLKKSPEIGNHICSEGYWLRNTTRTISDSNVYNPPGSYQHCEGCENHDESKATNNGPDQHFCRKKMEKIIHKSSFISLKTWSWHGVNLRRHVTTHWQHSNLSLRKPARPPMKTKWHQDDVIKWKHFPRYWPSVREIHRSPVNYPHKGQWGGALIFSFICAWISGWVNNHGIWWFETPSRSLWRHCNAHS